MLKETRSSTTTTTMPFSSRHLSSTKEVISMARSKSGLLQILLVCICVGTTAVFFSMDKRMSSLTRKMETDIEIAMEEHALLVAANKYLNSTSRDSSPDSTTTTTSRDMEEEDDTTSSTTTTTTTTDENKHSPYAYMFLIGGIDPAKAGYRGFLYNVMITADLLRQHGSKADIWLYLQMSPNTPMETLPDDETSHLKALGIKVKYMEKPETESFTDINMEKFRMLQMTQYRRILFLDADILPLMNMDYLFDLSDGDHPLLQPNFVVATLGEPANGGCFMLEPHEGSYEALLKVVADQRESAKDLGHPFFDREHGWGHSFKQHGDEWQGTRKAGSMWRWHGAHVDQGLLFYWTKYHQQAVTIFRGNVVENWVKGDGTRGSKEGQPFLEASFDPSAIEKWAPKNQDRIAFTFNCDLPSRKPDDYLCKVPYSHYAHFTGAKKPWQQGYDPKRMKETSNAQLNGAYRAFFNGLFAMSDRLNWGITPENVDDTLKGESPLGYLPGFGDFAKRQQGNDIYEKLEAQKKEKEQAKADNTNKKIH